MMCKSKSLPSASDGLQNYAAGYLYYGAYLSLGHYKRWLEWEFVSEKDIKVELVNSLVNIRAIDCRLVNLKLLV
jgi:hypothetical protein